MNVFEFTLLNSVFVFFPLLLYLIYAAYSKNIDKKENNLFLELALFSSFYLILRYGKNIEGEYLPMLIVNVPLIIAYIKKRPISIMLISLCLVFYYQVNFSYSLIILLFEYLLYGFIFILKEKKNLSDNLFICFFLTIKAVFFAYFLSLNQNVFSVHTMIEILFMVFLLVGVTYVCLVLFQKGEAIIDLHMTMKELEKEKQIQMSLFQITHEIKNPIAVCKGYLDMFDVNNPEHSKKYIPIMKEEIARTLILLQDFLSIQKMKIEKDILDINLLLEEIMISLTPLFKEKKIDVNSNLSDDEIFMNGDYNRLKQVFINIFKNSVEAMTNNRKHKLYLEINELDHNIEIKVTDNGIGITKENLKKMKNPFFSTKQNGTGLGVYLSSEIVKAHDGKIDFKSGAKGTTVTLLFPSGIE